MPSLRPKHSLSLEEAEIIGLKGLAFLADDQARLARFLSLTGLSPAALRASVGTPATLQAVLDYLTRDESLMLVFVAEASLAPEDVGRALERISRIGGQEDAQ